MRIFRFLSRWNRNSEFATDFLVEKRGAFRLYYRRTTSVESLLDYLLPMPAERLLSASLLPGRGKDCRAYRLSFAGRDFFIKQYRATGGVGRAKDLLRGSRPLRILRLGLAFLSRGIPVPQPLAVIEQGVPGFAAHTWLISEFLPGRPLWDAWQEAEDGEKKRLLTEAGKVLGRLHGSGCLHGDTHWGNLLVTGERGEEELVLIDFDGGSILPSPDFAAIRTDIQHFFRDLFRQRDFRDEFRDFFTAIWLCRLPQQVRPTDLRIEEIIRPSFSSRRKKMGTKAVREELERQVATAGMIGIDRQIWNAVEAIAIALSKGKKVLVLGDEKDAAAVQKFASRLAQPFARGRRVAVPLIADRASEDFADKVDDQAETGDILFNISTAPGSESLRCALQRGKNKGCAIIGMFGKDAGAEAPGDVGIIIPAAEPMQLRNAWAIILEVIGRLVEKTLLLP